MESNEQRYKMALEAIACMSYEIRDAYATLVNTQQIARKALADQQQSTKGRDNAK